MITAWILYAIVVGSLLGAGGLAMERMVRTHGLPSRWVWALTIALSLGVPLGQQAWRQMPRGVPVVDMLEPASLVQAAAPQELLPSEPAFVAVPQESILRLLDGPILVAWALSTGILLLFFAFLLIRTHSLRGRWRRGKVRGEFVLYSDEWGPAVVGVLRPQVVLPRWCQEVDDRTVGFILDHELEHVRAGDLRLIVAAGIFPVLFPWHLPLWWQLSRLRTAVEGDCDLRVLRRHPGQMKPYVDLLLEVGEKTSGRRPIAAMLSEPYQTLKRRIKIMTMPFPKRPWIRGGLLAAAGLLMVALACWAPGPTDAENGLPEAQLEEASPAPATGAAQAARRSAPPVFTPYTVSPDVKNPGEVMAALDKEYPGALKEAGVGGTVGVWFFVDDEGVVQRVLVNQSSGRQELDRAAISIANIIEFTPALNRDMRRPVWISLPIVFGSEGPTAGLGTGAAPGTTRDGVSARPAPRVAEVEGEANAWDPNEFGEIGGTAMDAASGVPLQYAQVFVSGTGYGTLSNQEGRFLIEDVPAGDHVVEAVLMGYARGSEPARVMKDEQTVVEFRIQAQAIALTPLVVSGGG